MPGHDLILIEQSFVGQADQGIGVSEVVEGRGGHGCAAPIVPIPYSVGGTNSCPRFQATHRSGLGGSGVAPHRSGIRSDGSGAPGRRSLENVPSFFHGAGAEIIARDRKGGAEVHFAIGSDGKSTLAAGAFDERLVA